MRSNHSSRPHRPQRSLPIQREWAFEVKDVLIILGIALGLSGLIGLGAIMLMELLGKYLH
jgi:hypothetical protein